MVSKNRLLKYEQLFINHYFLTIDIVLHSLIIVFNNKIPILFLSLKLKRQYHDHLSNNTSIFMGKCTL